MQEPTEKPPLQECNSCSYCTCVHNLGLSPVNIQHSRGRMFVEKYTSVGRGSGCVLLLSPLLDTKVKVVTGIPD